MKERNLYDNGRLMYDVRQYIKEHAITGKEFSKLANLDPSVISRLLCGKMKFNDKYAAAVCLVLDTNSADYIVESCATSSDYSIALHNHEITNNRLKLSYSRSSRRLWPMFHKTIDDLQALETSLKNELEFVEKEKEKYITILKTLEETEQ